MKLNSKCVIRRGIILGVGASFFVMVGSKAIKRARQLRGLRLAAPATTAPAAETTYDARPRNGLNGPKKN